MAILRHVATDEGEQKNRTIHFLVWIFGAFAACPIICTLPACVLLGFCEAFNVEMAAANSSLRRFTVWLQGSIRHPVMIPVVLCVGISLSLLSFAAIRNWEKRSVQKKATDLVGEQAEKLHITILRSMEVLNSITAFISVRGQPTREEFKQFVAPALARQPELQALSWNPLVPASRRAMFEAAAAADGLTGFQFREKNAGGHFQPAGKQDEYVPVYFIEPLTNNLPALGFDLSSDAERLFSLNRARDTAE